MRTRRAVITLAAGVFAACGEDKVNGPAAPVIPLYYLKAPTNSGDGQTDTVLATLALPFRVLVRRGDSPTSDITVLWEIPGDTLVGIPDLKATSVTDLTGVATSPFRLTLGRAAGTYMVRASVPGLIPPGPIFVFSDATCGSALCFTATATPGTPTRFRIAAGNGQTGATSTPLDADYIVEVGDSYGNGIPGVVIDWVIAAGEGSISPTQNATTAPQGHAAARHTLGPAQGTQRVTATASGMPGAPQVTFTATAFTPGSVASVTLAPESATVWVDGTVQLSAVLRDAHGLVLSGRSLSWTSDNTAVATVDASGLVKGTGPGTAAVTAMSEGVGDTAAIRVLAPPPPFTLAALAAGRAHSCGLTSDGAAHCWGGNDFGQLGNGSVTGSVTAVAVSGGLRFGTLVAGADHTCGLTNEGKAYCWGRNDDGQLGNGLFASSSIPVAVAGGLSFATLGTGAYHTCGLTSSGAAHCWGWNDFGQLGNGSSTSSSIPVAVLTGMTFRALATGFGWHTCALTSAGAAYCWGHNSDGELGNGSFATTSVPVAVSGGLTLSTLATGFFHTCGLTTTAGAAYCWGDNHWSELGDGSGTGARSAPGPVSGALSFGALAAGGGHTCGVLSSEAASCWGRNGYGQLGDGSTSERSTPVIVSGGLNFSRLAGGNDHTCGLNNSGVAYCWGNNSFGQLGNGTTTDSSVPVRVAGPQ